MKINNHFLYSVVISLCLLNISTKFILADSLCRIPMNELQSGVMEGDLGNIKIKMESYNHLAKVKLIGEVNEDWTSVSTENGQTGLISGYVGNGGDAQILTELVIKQDTENFKFAIFKVDPHQSSGSQKNGVAYFFDTNKVTCVSTSYQKWQSGRNAAFGEAISQRSSINLQRDGFGG